MMNGPSINNCTPTQPIKKKVSFADAAGFSLENVKTIPPYNGIDQVPFSAASLMQSKKRRSRYMFPTFLDPCQTDFFMERVVKQNVCLGSLTCDDFVVTGVVWVTNIDYVKEVAVRFTLDDWNSFRDVWGYYLDSNVDKKTEQFGFRVTIPLDFQVGLTMQFAVRYCVAGYEFWDNNIGRNYHLQCLEISD